tara:strand:+ start:6422 stop:7057 length:636 start_codon:yes stop_codon:yes gene_type:complete
VKNLERYNTIQERIKSRLSTERFKSIIERCVWKNSNELELLCEILAKNKVNNVIEIGTYKGLSASLFSSVISGVVHTINVNPKELKIAKCLWEDLEIDNIKSYKGDSLKLLPELLANVKDVNFIYIDGEHWNDYPLKEYEIILNNDKQLTNCLIYFDDGSTDVQNVLKKYNIGSLVMEASSTSIRAFDIIGNFDFDKKTIEGSTLRKLELK